jgi:hypothetical protein
MSAGVTGLFGGKLKDKAKVELSDNLLQLYGRS